ncbi:MAG: alpha/beta hydrolase [Oleispira antarctica]|nr:alpha/beta hydrolase [Oleispira antarctica]MBQ0792401.1 alpha/beta hydrolase [Oleispira antarctica]
MKETRISLSSGELAIQEWGNSSKPTMMCLHGWLDNGATFHRLAPLLAQDYHLLIVDLPGHGLSEPLAEGAHYYIWQNIEVLFELLTVKHLASVHLLGHSMGGVVASIFAGTFADKVSSLVLLDSLGPMTSTPEQTPQQLAKAIIDSQRTPSSLRTFAAIDDALNARKKSSPGMTDNALRPIVERNLKSIEGGYCWRTDARLRHTSKVSLGDDQVAAFLAAITAPVLVVLAEQGIVPRAWVEQRMGSIQRAQLVYLPGHHHFHAEPAPAESINGHIKQFLSLDS